MVQSKEKSATVFYNCIPAGILQKTRSSYLFTYDDAYLNQRSSRPVSITLPLRKETYVSSILFPVFINMLSEGSNKRLQCRLLKIDENDYFALLLATTQSDNVGPITIKEIYESE